MRIALINEAWHPQVNGVVTTWTHLTRILRSRGHEVEVCHAGQGNALPMPGYPEILIALNPADTLVPRLERFAPDAVHIATEGPLGVAGRAWCLRHGIPFTTSFHTQFPKYLKKYLFVPKAITYASMRWFHHAAERILVPTLSVKTKLAKHSFDAQRLMVWSRGVDSVYFRPLQPGEASYFGAEVPRPIFLCSGRVALEKNLDAFLKLDLPGTKVIVGDGQYRKSLMRRFPKAIYTGYLPPEPFAHAVRSADVFVFPSRTDTFGLVMLEANASGVPVAAFDTTGPRDVLVANESGMLGKDLRQAALDALRLDRARCREIACRHTWEFTCDQLFGWLAPFTRYGNTTH